MKPVPAPTTPIRARLDRPEHDAWRERSGRLFAEFERPARLMIRRAFRSAFSSDEIDDLYANAWVGTLHSLAGRHDGLTDSEIRSYVLTAVANQAGKEIRRRRRKPTAPLDPDHAGVADDGATPEERVAGAERSRIARDLLASLPKRRRAVMLLRYGWGLEPSQVCGLIDGLSPRAYRKEVTRGVDELIEKMRSFEQGDWCAEREPLLKTFAAGLADADEARQAKAHLSHCRDCSEFVARLHGHLFDLGSGVAVPAALDGLDGDLSLGSRLLEVGERARDAAAGLFTRGGPGPIDETGSQVASAGGARGAGAAGAGVLAKLAGMGAAGKLAVACVGGGVAATACVAAGLGPLGVAEAPSERPTAERAAKSRSGPSIVASPAPVPSSLPSQIGNEYVEPDPSTSPHSPAPEESTPGGSESTPGSTDPVAPETPPIEQEFGVPAAAAPPAPTPAASSSGGGDTSGGGSASTVRQEFGP